MGYKEDRRIAQVPLGAPGFGPGRMVPFLNCQEVRTGLRTAWGATSGGATGQVPEKIPKELSTCSGHGPSQHLP